MRNERRKLAFVLAASNHGSIIVNRFDYGMVQPDRAYGVGFQVLDTACFDPEEVEMVLQLLEMRRRRYGDGVVAIDCGANIGVHTIEWAIAMTGWGSVLGIEAQERIFYALAGNVALNNCFNATVRHAAVSSDNGVMRIPNLDYLTPSSFGSLELKQQPANEFIGQKVDYSAEQMIEIPKITLDELKIPRVDFIKIDIEGMELEALEGARQIVERSRPIILVEWIKTDADRLRRWLEERGYLLLFKGINVLAIHTSDETLDDITAKMAADVGRVKKS